MTTGANMLGVIGSRARRSGSHARSQVIHGQWQKTVAYSQRREGNVTTVTVTTSLGGTVYYHWFLDGVWVGQTTTNYRSFGLAADEQARIECVPSHDAYFDWAAHSPATPAARVLLWWIRSSDTGVKQYKVEQQKDAGDWTTIATVAHQDDQWDYRLTTPRLDDLGSYAWRITPVDAAGNEGSATALDARTIVRTPDAPNFAIAFDDGTTKVTFSEAA